MLSNMEHSIEAIDRQLRTMEGQVRGLRDHLSDADRTCADVAHLVGIIDGSWAKVKAGVLRGWVEDCLIDVEGVEEDGRIQQLLGAIGRVAAW